MGEFEWTDEMLAYFQTLDDSVQSGFLNTYKELAAALYEVDEATKQYEAIRTRDTKTDEEAAAKAEE